MPLKFNPFTSTFDWTSTSAATGPTNGIQLETGDFLLAEDGNYLTQE